VVEHCGAACTACPTISGGAATCIDDKCGHTCLSGFKPCGEQCIPDSQQCAGMCPMGQRACANSTCTMGECCEGDKRCSGLTVQSCMSGQWANGATCEFACNSGSCGGTCLPNDRRCNPNGLSEQTCRADASGWMDTKDCALGCDVGAKSCMTSCPGGTALINGACAACGSGKPLCCPGMVGTCSNNCGTTAMRTCRTDGTWDESNCPKNVACCRANDCPSCQTCNAGKCENQVRGQDVKNNCDTSKCQSGVCDGAGKCEVTKEYRSTFQAESRKGVLNRDPDNWDWNCDGRAEVNIGNCPKECDKDCKLVPYQETAATCGQQTTCATSCTRGPNNDFVICDGLDFTAPMVLCR
jgi:hypothetical protein